jgi:hypothetical protein
VKKNPERWKSCLSRETEFKNVFLKGYWTNLYDFLNNLHSRTQGKVPQVNK